MTALGGTNPYTVDVLARAVAAQGRLDEALALLRTARTRFPTFSPLHGSAAAFLLQAGRAPAAGQPGRCRAAEPLNAAESPNFCTPQ